MRGFIVVLFIVGLFFLSGILGIWILNTLFGLQIPYQFDTIVASVLLFGSIASGGVRANLKN